LSIGIYIYIYTHIHISVGNGEVKVQVVQRRLFEHSDVTIHIYLAYLHSTHEKDSATQITISSSKFTLATAAYISTILRIPSQHISYKMSFQDKVQGTIAQIDKEVGSRILRT
jgi:hypothetical protein